MSKARPETNARHAYIRILTQYAEAVPTKTDPDTALLGELIEAELLTGGAARGATGQVIAANATGITVEGRLFLQRLREEERQDRLLRKSLKYVPILIGYAAGLLSPLLTDWIRSLLK